MCVVPFCWCPNSSGALDVDVAVLSARTYCDGLLGRVGSAVAVELVAHTPVLRGQVEPGGDAVPHADGDRPVAALDLDGSARDLAQLDAAVGGLRRGGGERLRDLEVAVGERCVEVAAGLPDRDGAVWRLEDRVAGHRTDPDLAVVGRDLDPALS